MFKINKLNSAILSGLIAAAHRQRKTNALEWVHELRSLKPSDLEHEVFLSTIDSLIDDLWYHTTDWPYKIKKAITTPQLRADRGQRYMVLCYFFSEGMPPELADTVLTYIYPSHIPWIKESVNNCYRNLRKRATKPSTRLPAPDSAPEEK